MQANEVTKSTSRPTPKSVPNRKPQVKAQIAASTAIESGEFASENAQAGWHNEPDPTMRSLNPFTQARNLGMKTQVEIAAALGIDSTEIMRLEQAIFPYVPRKFIDYYTSELKLPDGWEIGYRSFQRKLRETAARPIFGIWQMPPGELTFRRWRIYNWPTMGQMAWCKSFCIHPSGVYAMERGGKINVSGDILMALVEAKIMNEEQARNFASRIRHANLNRAGEHGKNPT